GRRIAPLTATSRSRPTGAGSAPSPGLGCSSNPPPLSPTMATLELNDHDKSALAAILRTPIAGITGLILVIATAAAAPAQTADALIISRPSNAAVSPNLSDLPTAQWSGRENPKVVPRPKPLPPRKAGVNPSKSANRVLNQHTCSRIAKLLTTGTSNGLTIAVLSRW